jgi:hypothetical protein
LAFFISCKKPRGDRPGVASTQKFLPQPQIRLNARGELVPSHPTRRISACQSFAGANTPYQKSSSTPGKPASAPASDKKRIAAEAFSAFQKAVTDQGLSVNEYMSILEVAQNDPEVGDKIRQLLPTSPN